MKALRPKAFVLAGGAGSRMGRDKTQLPWGGRTLLEHALCTLRSAGFEPAIAGLREPVAASAPCIPDNHPGDGPLAGLEAALRTLAPPQLVLFIPVDLPLLPPSFLRVLFERAHYSGALATVSSAGGRPQPLCSVLSAELASEVSGALQGDDRKVMRVLARAAGPGGFDLFEVEALTPLYGWEPHRWFSNLNVQKDYSRLQHVAHMEISRVDSALN